MNGAPPTLGIVTALEMERRWIRSAVMVEVGGMGRIRAEAAATRLLDRGATALVSWGIAGGLEPGLASGTVVVPETVLGPQGESLHVDAAWRDRLLAVIGDRVSTSCGSMLHSDEVVASPGRKSELFERWRAVAVDMESVGVAQIARNAGVPWLAIRVVGDTADRELPKVVAEIADESGRLRARAVLGLALRPGSWPALISLGRANAAAGRSMRRVWTLAGPDLVAGELGGR